VTETDWATLGVSLGPVQMLVLEFDRERVTGQVLPELRRLGEAGTVRLLDLLIVTRHGDTGELEITEKTDLSDAEFERLAPFIAALVGLGSGGEHATVRGAVDGVAEGLDAWYLADRIPAGTTAAVLLIEHLWAIPLRDAISGAGGIALADEWVHPADLVAVGMAGARGQAQKTSAS
jgi:hypothetical protein